MEQDIKYIKNYVVQLEEENKAMKRIVNAISVNGPDEERAMWIEIDHEEMLGACTFRHGVSSMIGQVVYDFGKILQDVKNNLRP